MWGGLRDLGDPGSREASDLARLSLHRRAEADRGLVTGSATQVGTRHWTYKPPPPSTGSSAPDPFAPRLHRSPCTASWVAASSVPGWGPSCWWWPQRQTTGCSTGCRGPSPTRACGDTAWATSATCRQRASVRLRGGVCAAWGQSP